MSQDHGNPIWHKGTSAEDWVTRFTVGEDAAWDTLLLPYDCVASEAHAWGLAQIGVLTADEHAEIARVLSALRTESEAFVSTLRLPIRDSTAPTASNCTGTCGRGPRSCHANWKSPPRPRAVNFVTPFVPRTGSSSVAPSETVPTASAVGTLSVRSETVARGAKRRRRVSRPMVVSGTSILSVNS